MQLNSPTDAGRGAVVRTLLLCSAAFLAACADDPLAPRDSVRPNVLSLNGGGCQDIQPTRVLPSNTPPTLAGVTVTANYSGGSMPWDVMQQMQFPLYYGADRAPCFNAPGVTYSTEPTYLAAVDSIPAPEGVDARWWAELSPREQRALLKYAEEMMRLYPKIYREPGDVIATFFQAPMIHSKQRAKLRALDFFGATPEAELFAGGVYGCTLYQNLIREPDWILSNNQTLDLVIELVTAFAEAEFVTRPYRGLAFGRNGAVGAAMAAADGFGSDCGQMLFSSISGGRVTVDDPYAPPPGPGTGGGRTPEPSPGDLPPGWYPY